MPHRSSYPVPSDPGIEDAPGPHSRSRVMFFPVSGANFHVATMTAVGVVTFSRALTLAQSISITAIGTSSIVKALSKVNIAITALATPTIVKALSKVNIAITATGVASTVVKFLAKVNIPITATGLVTVARQFIAGLSTFFMALRRRKRHRR